MKTVQQHCMSLLLAEDDDDDYMLIQDAFRDSLIANDLVRVCDGEELLAYLRRTGEYATRANRDPAIILMDLNMPKMDGRTALREIKSDAALRHYPVIVLTTSKTEEDVLRSYQIGVNAFMQKPGSFETLVRALKSFENYWLQIVELPTARGQG
jgi:CheY-like chemotaxis protein